jgi:outer membrane lipoprotein
MNIRIPTAGLALCLLAACATQPKPLQGEFQALTPHDAAVGDHSGAVVRWGGRIIRTEPRPDRTCFEVISTKLNADGRPYWASDDTWGRFIACRTGFYDPVYRFPRVAADVVYLWPERERVNVVTRPAPWPWAWNW